MHYTTIDDPQDLPSEDVPSEHTDYTKAVPELSKTEPPATSFKSILAQFAYHQTPMKSTSPTMAPNTRRPTGRTTSDRLALSVTKANARNTTNHSEHTNEKTITGSIDSTINSPLSKRKINAEEVARTSRKKPRISKDSVLIPAGSVNNKLVDSLRPGLTLVMVGVNPGIKTGETGHAYSHHSNKFWPLMYSSGITPVQHKPADTHALMDLYGIGHTNIVPAASIAEKDIPKDIYQAGAKILDEKIRNLRPQAVALVGKNIWKNWIEYRLGRKFNDKKDEFEYGWQKKELWVGRIINPETGEVEWEGARTTVLPTTSAACAIWMKKDGDTRIKHWKPVGEWFAPKREEWIRAREPRGIKVEGARMSDEEIKMGE